MKCSDCILVRTEKFPDTFNCPKIHFKVGPTRHGGVHFRKFPVWVHVTRRNFEMNIFTFLLDFKVDRVISWFASASLRSTEQRLLPMPRRRFSSLLQINAKSLKKNRVYVYILFIITVSFYWACGYCVCVVLLIINKILLPFRFPRSVSLKKNNWKTFFNQEAKINTDRSKLKSKEKRKLQCNLFPRNR